MSFKYELFVFFVLIIQGLFSRGLGAVKDIFVPFYLPDYTLGFCSRMLLGSIIYIFNKTPSEAFIHKLALTVYILTIIAASFVLGRLIKKNSGKRQKIIFSIVLLFITGPFTFVVFSLLLGMFDIYWLIFCVLSLFLLNKKYLRFFIPILCFMGIAINFGYILTFIPVVFIAMLYDLFNSEKNKIGAIFNFIITSISTGLSSLYFVFFGKSSLKVTQTEFNNYIIGKLGPSYNKENFFFHYYDYYFFENYNNQKLEYSSPFEYITDTIKYIFSLIDDPYFYVRIFFVFLLISFAFVFLWFVFYKNTDKKQNKFIIILMMLLPLIFFIMSLFSTDILRWASAVIFSEFIMILFFIYRKDNAFEKSIDNLLIKYENNKPLFIIFFCFYISCIYENFSSF